MKLVRPHSPTQYLRIFVIVHITSFFVSKTVLDSYYGKSSRQPQQQIHRKPSSILPVTAVPSFHNASETLNAARSNTATPPPPFQGHPTQPSSAMAPRGKTENTKKVAGNARKAEVAAQKQSAAEAASEANEATKWDTGAKSNKKAADAAEKKAAAAAAKAERDKLLAEEEKNQPAKPKGAGAKKAEKRTNAQSRGTLNLDALDDTPSSTSDAAENQKERTLNATGIDNALDALSLTSAPASGVIDRHPERRFKAAYKAFEEWRLPEIESENPGLRRNQRVEQARREFEKHPDNPFNQTSAAFDASREEVAEMKRRVREGVEGRLGEK